MTITCAIIGSLHGISTALAIAGVDMDELYTSKVLRRITVEEGYPLATKYSARHSWPQTGGDAA